MSMNPPLLPRLFLLAALLGVAAPACAAGDAGPDGPPQPWFTFTVLRDFEPLAGNQVVVWPDRAGRAWLLVLAPPCTGLADVPLLGLTAAARRIVSGVDEAVVDGRRCRIQRLYRLDPARRAELVPAQRGTRVVAVRPRPPGEQRPVRLHGGP